MALTAQLVTRSGGNSAQGIRVKEVWNVQTSDGEACSLGPLRVMATGGIPQYGAPYLPDDSCDGLLAILTVTNIEVGDPYVAGGACAVDATVTYEQSIPTDQQQKPIPFPWFNTSQDPLDWLPTIDVSTTTRSVATNRLYFLGAYTNNPLRNDIDPCQTTPAPPTLVAIANQLVTNVKDTWVQSTNTAGDPFEPAFDLETTDVSYTITKNLATWDPNDVFACFNSIAVNNADFRINLTAQVFNKVFKEYTMRIARISARPAYREWWDTSGTKQSRKYWETHWELHYRPMGWYVEYLNAGFNAVRVGRSLNMEDGKGGTVKYSVAPSGSSRTGPIEFEGRPIEKPIPLDLEGKPVALDTQPIIMRYLQGIPKDFRDTLLALPGAAAP